MQAELSSNRTNCALCLSQLKYPYGKPGDCSHLFCFDCIDDWMKKRYECPLCHRATSHIVQIGRSGFETKTSAESGTVQEFEAELAVHDEEDGKSSKKVGSVTVAHASCH
ncbi:unnamed protein product, partial [Gongylonema pulchrum]|uniref:RING-type E3 ubiquitin transferase n=1 Tax=Gongylonema pulchrum TaxID=637853 RepID=A0A183DKW4_9BILA